jgi:nucleoside-diphosphate-sugar epimerase
MPDRAGGGGLCGMAPRRADDARKSTGDDMKRLIGTTGLNGFLGRHLGAALLRNGYETHNIPLSIRRDPEALNRWISVNRPAAVFHLAGIVDVGYCRANPLEAVHAHIVETSNLLEALRLSGPETPLIYVATDKSFGEQQDCELETPYRPVFAYDSSKACADIMVESFRASYNLPIHLLRFPNFYGENDVHLERLVPSVCIAAANDTPLVVRTRTDGTYRQYIYVQDAVGILLSALERVLSGADVAAKSHFGPSTLKCVGDVIADVQGLSGRAIEVTVLNQPNETSTISLKDENQFGYAYTDWLDGLARTFAFYSAMKSG